MVFAPLSRRRRAASNPTLGESAKAVVGTWEFSNADRDKICTAVFTSDRTAVGFKVEFDKNCGSLFPLVNDVAGWTYPENDLLNLLDAGGKALVEFSEVEDGIFEAPTPGVGVLFLQNPAAAGPPPKPPEQLAGDWAIVRGGGAPLCVLTLATSCRAGRSGDHDQAGLRSGHRALELDAVAHRSRRIDAGLGARQSMALRGGRRQ